jgi:hypothetical protein
MTIKLIRTNLTERFTDGELYIDGKFFCYTVEDKVRAKRGMWSKLLKVYAQTAIPYGRYPVLVTWSNRFKRPLTGIFNVPDFEGIRMHNGSTERSSAGCVIVSYKRLNSGMLLNEVKAMNDLCDIVAAKQKTEKIWIEIE